MTAPAAAALESFALGGISTPSHSVSAIRTVDGKTAAADWIDPGLAGTRTSVGAGRMRPEAGRVAMNMVSKQKKIAL